MKSLLLILLVILFSYEYAYSHEVKRHRHIANMKFHVTGKEVMDLRIICKQYDPRTQQMKWHSEKTLMTGRNDFGKHALFHFHAKDRIRNLQFKVKLFNETSQEYDIDFFTFAPSPHFSIQKMSKTYYPEVSDKSLEVRVKYFFKCIGNLVGPKCTHECTAISPRACDTQGRHVCKEGFGGENCDEKFTEKNCKCDNGGVCYSAIEMVDGKEGKDRTLCHCRPLFKGERCEIGEKRPPGRGTDQMLDFIHGDPENIVYDTDEESQP